VELGRGAEGPWEDHTEPFLRNRPHISAAGAWENETYIVQLFRHVELKGGVYRPDRPLEHLAVRRVEGTDAIPWEDLESIKDQFATDGERHWAIEVYPPSKKVVNRERCRHLWVMPLGWEHHGDLSE
jgi:hypothetical protein